MEISAREILSYVEEKLRELDQQYDTGRVNRVSQKMNASWLELLAKLRGALDAGNLALAKKIIDEHIQALRHEIVRSFD